MYKSMFKPLDKRQNLLRSLVSRAVGLPFVLLARWTKWDIDGRKRLLLAVEEHQRTARGLVTLSNHVSALDDPLVLIAMLCPFDFNERTKLWYSIACDADFSPTGALFAAGLARACFSVANLVYVSRTKRRGGQPPAGDAETLSRFAARTDDRLRRRLQARAREIGTDVDSYVASFFTTPYKHASSKRLSPLNQIGLLEACARCDTGDWIHIFPEGGRSRTVQLGRVHAGLGKILYYTDPIVVPLCMYGTQDVLPIDALVPRLHKSVVVTVGYPIERSALAGWREAPPTIATFRRLAEIAMSRVASLRGATLARYYVTQSTGLTPKAPPEMRSLTT
jgi:1-acyl-sn-glycerol-3-phosphate acyltransferase